MSCPASLSAGRSAAAAGAALGGGADASPIDVSAGRRAQPTRRPCGPLSSAAICRSFVRSASRPVRLEPGVGEGAHTVARRGLHRDLEVRAVGRWNVVAQPGHLLVDDLALGVEAVDEQLDLRGGLAVLVLDPAAQDRRTPPLSMLPVDVEVALPHTLSGCSSWPGVTSIVVPTDEQPASDAITATRTRIEALPLNISILPLITTMPGPTGPSPCRPRGPPTPHPRRSDARA